MWKLSVLAFLATAAAQIPSLGWCPLYLPIENFSMKDFLGTWYEAERYFTVSELISRCVTTKYEATPEGRIVVSNEITNSLTGLKRVLEGGLQMIGREGEGRMLVKYSALPIPYDTEYTVLGTDYENYAVLWSCSGIGPVHTQNVWVMTRERLAPIAVMQAAYGVLDKFKISRTFFVKTNQADCTIFPDPAAKEQEEVGYKHADVQEKSAVVVPNVVVDKVGDQPLQVVPVKQKVDPEVKSEVVKQRSAIPLPEEEPKKPLQVPELILSESPEKKEEKIDKPTIPPKEEPMKKDKKEESSESKVMEISQ